MISKLLVLTLTFFVSYSFSLNIENKVLYFAYGSNLLQRRIHINIPSASFYGIAELQGYRLDFNLTVPSWQGAVATIASDPTGTVWGALWTIDKSSIDNLDKQEGVDKHWYYPKNVTVTTPEGRQLVARTYKEYFDPPKLDPAMIPTERKPSITYLQVIILGAYECRLPARYFGYLWKFPSNGNFAEPAVSKKLGYPFDVYS